MKAYCSRTALLIWFLMFIVSVDSYYYVTISQNGPVVRGANITFRADLFNSFGQPAKGTFWYVWKDNAIPQHTGEVEVHSPWTEWVVSFPASVYAPGTYEVDVTVSSSFLYWPLCSQRALFNITALLNGDLALSQRNRTVFGKFVSNSSEAVHRVQLGQPDRELLERNATSVVAYWFVDCVYYGSTGDLSLRFNYSGPEATRVVEALVVASYEPPATTTTTPATTTTTPTTTTPTTTTVAPANTTTPPPTTTTVATTTTPTTTSTTTTTPAATTTTASAPPGIPRGGGSHNVSAADFPFVCGNGSVMPDPKKSYGLFRRHVVVRAPVSGIEVSGSNWLQHGDMVNLTVSFNGSVNFTHCIQPKQGSYNVTGNETCKNEGALLRERKFRVIHYFRYPGTYVLLMIISNDVSRVVYPVTINIYEVTKQAQLSVIVVPVTCSLLAVILMVFGVAYYVQSRNRYTVEVADFDFGKASDMEYKTFRERLRESLANSINRPADAPQQEYTRFSK
ncbi:uncharacterized protein LOC134541196 isoform X2 [Bacillus rossius redtenbacheri]|uniref:uncharacterized protein LOC134541196 isoform X2 n=1 Tax=Bacillus rossius redtenbacheri TaxID=93214 RepID=UPI002FDDD714